MKAVFIAVFCVGIALAKLRSAEVSSSEEQLPYHQLYKTRDVKDKTFQHGREYKFVYNGQILTGIPGSDRQHSGSKIQAVAQVQFQSEQRVVLQLSHIRIAKANRDVSNPRKALPFRAFEEVELDQANQEKLQKPVFFTYTNGLVHDIRFEHGEAPWSANIKRGVLNLLQVNLKEHHKIETESTVLSRQHGNAIKSTSGSGSSESEERSTEVSQKQKTNRFYRAVEKTLEGECETEYMITSQPWKHAHEDTPVLNVTKSINFEECTTRPQIKYNWRFADYCPTCEPKYQEDEKFLKSSTVLKFNITGTPSKFMIESASAESQYMFVPLAEDANVITTYVVQRLDIVKTSAIQSEIRAAGETITSDSDMIYTVDWDAMKEKFFMEGEKKFFEKTPYSQIPDKVRVVAELLQKLVASMSEHVEQQAPQWFSRLVTVFRMATRSEIEQLHTSFFENKHEQFTPEEHKKVKEIITSVAAIAGTKDSVSHLIKNIREKRIPEWQASQALRQMMSIRVVSQSMLHELKSLCIETSTSAHYSQHYLKQSCWLTYGSLANALCAPNEDQLAMEQKVNPEKLCPISLKDEIVKTLFEHLEKSTNWEDQLILIKSIANAGIDTSIFRLEKIIKNAGRRYPVFLRVEAMLALKNLRDQMPRKIQKMLLPVYNNVRDHPEVRTTAMYEILNTQPERPILEMIAKQLNSEPSRQVASATYTFMTTLANSTQPCFYNMTRDLKLALRFTKEINAGVQYSKLFHMPMQSQTHGIGADLNFANVMSNSSLIPFHSALSLDTNWLGSWQRHMLSVGFSSEGLETLLYKLFSEEGFFYENAFEDFVNMRGHPKNVRMPYEQELRELFSTLKINARQFKREPKAWFYMKFKGQEVGFLPLSKQLINSLIETDRQTTFRSLMSKVRQGMQINFNKATLLHESEFKIPTSIGLPLVYRHKVPAVISIKGKIQLESTQLVLDIKPSVAIQSTHSMEVWSPIFNSGLKIRGQARAHLPLKMRAMLDLHTKSVKLVIEPPKTPKEILVIETRPLTFTRVWPKTIQVWKEDEEKTIVGKEHNRVLSYERSYGKKYTGVELKVRSRIHITPKFRLAGTPFCPFSGPNKVVLEVIPSAAAPQEFEIKAEAIFGTKQSERMSLNMKDFWVPTSIESSESSESSSSSSSSESGSDSKTVSKSSQSASSSSEEKKKRRSRTAASRSKEFSSEEFEYNAERSLKMNEVKLEVIARGGQHSSKKLASLVVAQKYSYDWRYSKLTMKMQNTPLASQEPWMLCADAEAMYPKSQLTSESKNRKVVAKAELKWGQTCSSDKFVVIKVQAQPSERQWYLNKYVEDEDCEYYEHKKLASPVACHERQTQYARLNQLKVEMEYKNVPASMRNVTDKLFRFAKYQYYWQTEVNSVVKNQPNKVLAKITLDPESYQRVNITVKTPNQSVWMKYIPLPFKLRALNFRKSIASDFIAAITEDKYQSYGKSICKVNDRKVKTFDGSTYRVPISTCYSLLAKDCTEEKSFAILMKKQSATTQEKKLKIVTKQHKLVLYPAGSHVKVELNEREYNVDSQELIREHGHEVLRVSPEASYLKVDLVELGVTVYFDGYSANIKMSPIYMGRQCGLCGEYDSESSWGSEFWSPSGEPSRDVRRFYLDYTVKDAECEMPRLETICKGRESCSHESSSSEESTELSASHESGSSSSSSSSSSEQTRSSSKSSESSRSRERSANRSRKSSSSEEQRYRKKGKRTPILKTKLIEEVSRTCFSTEQLPICPKNTYASAWDAIRDVEYQCLSNTDSRVSDLLIQVRRGRQVDISSHVRKTFTVKERLPTSCRYF
jgi:hypothetical protein